MNLSVLFFANNVFPFVPLFPLFLCWRFALVP